MNQFWSGNECERTHTLTTTTTGSKCSQKEANNQTDYQSHNALGPKGPFFTGSWSWMKSSAKHTLITEKNPKWLNKVTKSHNVGKRLFSGFLVSFASGVVEWNCWMKQQSNTQKQGALTAFQTGCLGALHGSQSLTALNS